METFKRILIAIIFAAFVTLLFTMPSCRTIEKVEYVHHYDTVVLIDHKVDSLYVKDSTYIYSKADTVYYIKWKERIKYIEKKDSIYINSNDTLYLDRVEYKEVEKKRRTRDIFAIIGVVSLLSLVGYVLYKLKS